MSELDDPPGGWTVWSHEPGGRIVLAFRPDVFDGGDFPSACLPTITVAPGRSPDRPAGERERSAHWHVALYLEPAVRVRDVETSHDRRASAIEAAFETASAFARGDIDYRGVYQQPRDAYLAQLDDLVETS